MAVLLKPFRVFNRTRSASGGANRICRKRALPGDVLCTSSDPQHSHDPDDGGVDGQGSVDLYLLQGDAHH